MSGSLVLLDSVTASNDTSIILSGIDSTYDVFQVVVSNAVHSTGDYDKFRFTSGSPATPDTTAKYDNAYYVVRGLGAFYYNLVNDQTYTYISPYTKGNGSNDITNLTMHIFCANISTQGTYAYWEEASISSPSEQAIQTRGSTRHQTYQTMNGVNFFMDTGSYTSGEFRLYGLKK